jgi:hypothetical protein
MKNETPKQTKKTTKRKLRHQFEYNDFVLWIAMPKSLRNPKTQRELALRFGIGEDTLSDWKNLDGFWVEVEALRKTWGRERTPNVLLALYNRIIRTGEASAVRLWYEIVEDKKFNEKDVVVTCAHCEKYREIEELSDEQLRKRINEAEAFFKKQ